MDNSKMIDKSKKLQAKDLINVGIFTAIYFVITAAVAMLGVIPIFLPLASILVPLIGGIPFILFITKVNKFGMVLIMSMICGIMMLITGMGYWSLLTCAISGIVAEFILKSGRYISAKKSILCYAVFTTWIIGNYGPIYTARESYLARIAIEFSPEYANALNMYFQIWLLPVLVVAAFVSGLIGGIIGKAVLKKHFQRGGIV